MKGWTPEIKRIQAATPVFEFPLHEIHRGVGGIRGYTTYTYIPPSFLEARKAAYTHAPTLDLSI